MSISGNRPQEKYVLTITAENVISTDTRFTMDNLSLGDNYKPLDAYFEKANGDIIRRNYVKGERKTPIKHCHVLPVRYLRSSFRHCLLRIRRIFLYVNIIQTAV